MARKLEAGRPVMNKQRTLPKISNGGTNAENIVDAVSNLGGMLVDEIGAVDGIARLGADKKLPLALFPNNANSGSTVTGLATLVTNQSSNYTITNYNDFIDYNIIALDGSVSRSGSTITYIAPATAKVSGFIINGRKVNITIIDQVPATPTVTSPADNATGLTTTVNATSSAFAMITGSDTHAASDWQIATDSSFTNIISQTVNDTTNKVSWTSGTLLNDTAYYIRVRHKGTTYGYGGWSAPNVFNTGSVVFPTSEETVLLGYDSESLDRFGSSVSATSNGDRVVVGARLANPISGGTTPVDAGAVYVFKRTGNTWAHEARLIASDRSNGDQFGTSVSVDSTGTRIVVGAPLDDNARGSNAGAMYVFSRSGTTWTQEVNISSPINFSSALFGTSVDISDDGTRVVVGAPNMFQGNTAEGKNTGKAWVYIRSGTNWNIEDIIGSSQSIDQYLGGSVAISGDGTRVVVGAIGADPGGVHLSNTGGAFIFTRSGSTWTQEAALGASDKDTSDRFGNSVAISSDGTRCAIGALLANPGGVSDAGAVYIFSRSGTTWAQEAKLVASDKVANNHFGSSVAIDNAGTYVIVGSPDSLVNGFKIGASYIFSRSGTTWTEEIRLTNSSLITNGFLGISVAITGDSTRAIVGGDMHRNVANNQTGVAYVYR